MNHLTSLQIGTPLGPMIAVSDEEKLYLLEFTDNKKLAHKLKKFKRDIIPGKTKPLDLIKQELKRYFEGNLQTFKTPVFISGTSFQNGVWQELCKIPYGKTLSYLAMAEKMGKPTSFRALANANGANLLSIIVPCHRVINTGGALGGYGGGLDRKKHLLNLEKNKV